MKEILGITESQQKGLLAPSYTLVMCMVCGLLCILEEYNWCCSCQQTLKTVSVRMWIIKSNNSKASLK